MTIKTADSINEEEIAQAVAAAEQKKTVPADDQETDGADVDDTVEIETEDEADEE